MLSNNWRLYKNMKFSKRENHLFDLRNYTLANRELETYLLNNSNLPGKRGNIELGYSFADYIEENYYNDKSNCFNYCLRLISENNEETGQIGDEEFLPFCAIVALGRIDKIDKKKRR